MVTQSLEVGSQAGVAPPVGKELEGEGRGNPRLGTSRAGVRPYPAREREAVLRALEASQQSLTRFCKERGLSAVTVGAWQRKYGSVARAVVQRQVFDPDQKRRVVEAFLKSGLTQRAFAQTVRVNLHNLQRWVSAWRRDGPKALEGKRVGRPRGSGTGSKLPVAVQEEILHTQRRFPDFGQRKLVQWLMRFRGVRASTGSVARVLRANDVDPQPVTKAHRQKSHLPRRFERSRPGELWQSDITSFVLRRHGLRVYLTVFLDDFSRYVVGWALEAHQKSELVTVPLLEAIACYGKPLEILTDQGRQYFVWRGKSAFQKLLVRHGIEHVVARTHHPQTLGKCERLWSTVGQELWDRARPDDLTEARERLGHFFAHYNFFRPHQGIDGLVPADRYFQAESALRATLEAKLAQDELALALGERPRQSVYLFGQIGDRQVSLHGERGKLVVHTPEGSRIEIDPEDLGAPEGVSLAERAAEESDAACQSDECGLELQRNGDLGDERRAAAEEDALLPQAGARGDAAAHSTCGAGDLEALELGGAPGGAQEGDAAPFDVAGPQEQGGDRERAGAASAESVAAQPDGAVGYAGGPSEAAASTAWEGGNLDGERGEPEPAQAAHCEAGAGEPRPQGGLGADPDDAQRGGAPVEVASGGAGGHQSPREEAATISKQSAVGSGRACWSERSSGGVS